MISSVQLPRLVWHTIQGGEGELDRSCLVSLLERNCSLSVVPATNPNLNNRELRQLPQGFRAAGGWAKSLGEVRRERQREDALGGPSVMQHTGFTG